MMRSRSGIATALVVAVAMGITLTACSSGSSSSGNTTTTSSKSSGPSIATQGVTSSEIHVGIPWVDFQALKSIGVNINHGNYVQAYTALIDHMNAQGGINGRKIVPTFVPENPASSTDPAKNCAQLTQDDKVFSAFGPVYATCYLNAGVSTIAGVYATGATAGAAENFNLTPPASALDPLIIKTLGTSHFKGKKVAIYAGGTADASDLGTVEADIKAQGGEVVSTGTNTAPASDQAATNQQFGVIAQKFQSAGANLVVALGSGSNGWPTGLVNDQISYNPSWIAMESDTVIAYAQGATASPSHLTNMVTLSPSIDQTDAWKTPAIQQCASIVKAKYPNDQMVTTGDASTNTTFVSVVQSCQILSLFEQMAKAAGKNLTADSFIQAGYGLKDIKIPGVPGTLSFGQNQPYAIGNLYPGKYDVAKKVVVVSPVPYKSS
jgi:hypothetical protein